MAAEVGRDYLREGDPEAASQTLGNLRPEHVDRIPTHHRPRRWLSGEDYLSTRPQCTSQVLARAGEVIQWIQLQS